MKVALVYDRVNKWGGAERVLLTLQEMFPEAVLYTSVYRPDKARWAHTFSIRTSYLQKIPGAAASHEYYAALMPSAFESFSFDEYDLVISVTSEAAKGILTKPGTKHLSYCLTPTRYLWSGFSTYFANPLLRFLATPVVAYLRSWDVVAAHRPDHMIAISQEVKKRIKTYYDIEADVIYPPLNLLPQAHHSGIPPSQLPYFLVVSRFVPYKRIDIAIQACNELNLPLLIIGTGSEDAKLRALAGPTVTFTGSLTDDFLAEYYKNCIALIFPGEEDFGLTVLEAQSFGKPVIAYKKGGAVETIVDGKTGVFFLSQTKDALKKVLQSFDATQFSPDDCRKQADRFDTKRFKQAFQAAIRHLFENRLT